MKAKTSILKVKNCDFYTLPTDFFECTLVTADCLETIVDNRLILDDGQEGSEFYARSVDLSYVDYFLSSKEIKSDKLMLLTSNHTGYYYKVKRDKNDSVGRLFLEAIMNEG